jgi:hypothetical protein
LQIAEITEAGHRNGVPPFRVYEADMPINWHNYDSLLEHPIGSKYNSDIQYQLILYKEDGTFKSYPADTVPYDETNAIIFNVRNSFSNMLEWVLLDPTRYAWVIGARLSSKLHHIGLEPDIGISVADYHEIYRLAGLNDFITGF